MKNRSFGPMFVVGVIALAVASAPIAFASVADAAQMHIGGGAHGGGHAHGGGGGGRGGGGHFRGHGGGGGWGGGYYGGGYYGGVCGPIQLTLGLCGPYGY
ncbi:MAG: hypothetical protein ABR970_19040 [Roseiarcus sp.]